MRVDCEQRDANAVLRAVVLHDALDGSSRLALVEHDGLVVEDSPTFANVGIQARRVGAPARAHSGGPQVPARVDRHHVR